MNSINLIGRMTKDPELQESKNTKYTRFSIAVDRVGVKDKVDFFNCTAFGKTAEIVCEYCRKGNQIGINGSMETERKDKITYFNVVVNRITLISTRNSDNSYEQAAPEPTKPVKPAEPETMSIDDDDEYPF